MDDESALFGNRNSAGGWGGGGGGGAAGDMELGPVLL